MTAKEDRTRMSDILNKVRKMNWLLQETPSKEFSFDELCGILGELMEANVTIFDNKGELVGVALDIPEDTNLKLNDETGSYYLPEKHIKELNKIDKTMVNIDNDDTYKLINYKIKTASKLHTLIPIVGGGERWGTLLLTRYEPEFTDDDVALGEFGATIVGLVLHQRKMSKEKDDAKAMANVQMAIGTLSYSETEAVQHIFAELEGDEGILVASRIADKSGITRSVIVNALRKLESASVIETRSLGMKGTRIKILNPMLKAELEKVK